MLKFQGTSLFSILLSVKSKNALEEQINTFQKWIAKNLELKRSKNDGITSTNNT